VAWLWVETEAGVVCVDFAVIDSHGAVMWQANGWWVVVRWWETAQGAGGAYLAAFAILFIPPPIPVESAGMDRNSGGIRRNEPEFRNSGGFRWNPGGNPPSIHYQRHNYII
jgi:hypothetical protein